jgi:hypothetical protein
MEKTFCVQKSWCSPFKWILSLWINLLHHFSKGPESESLAIGHNGNKLIVFLGNERPGSISIYSFNGDMTTPTFESVYWDIPNSQETWTQAFNQRTLSSLDPEDIK